MKTEVIHLEETASTNDYLRAMPTPQPDGMTVAVARHQTAGRGQGTNTWESEAGKNLLFSILTHPVGVDIMQQFVLSMAGALALKDALDGYCDGISLKWPNDIYWRDRKISGTLIETSVRGKGIERCIYGIGLNVNQRIFRSDAPNPVSLVNIIGCEVNTDVLLDGILRRFAHWYALAFSPDGVRQIVDGYNKCLYRREGMHPYEDVAEGRRFLARIDHVGTDGRLRLTDESGRSVSYTLKEVRFVRDDAR